MLPTKKTPPKLDIATKAVVLYGSWKLGKSTFCNDAPNNLFLATEPGLDDLDCYQVPITSWETFTDAVDEILAGKHDYKTITIDTADAMYRWCCEWVCKKYNKSYVGDIGKGTGWGVVNNEIERVIRKLKASPYGLFLTSHTAEKTIEDRTGDYTKIIPSLSGKARELVLGLADIILYGQEIELDKVDTEGKKIKVPMRVLRTRATKFYEAGQRRDPRNQYLKPLPDPIPLSFDAFKKAYDESVAEMLKSMNDNNASK